MFEAILSLCLPAQPEMCRDMLIPGHEARTETACSESASNLPGITCKKVATAAKIQEIAPNVFVHQGMISDAHRDNRGDVSNLGFVIGKTSVAVIDTGGSRLIGEELYRAVRTQTDLPISHVILTHMHPDHVLGASVFKEVGAQVVGHANLERALLDRETSYLQSFGSRIGGVGFLGTEVVTPDLEVAGDITIDLGARILTVKSWPQSHTSTDITVLDETTATLFAGDLVFDQHTPALDGSVTGWQAVLKDLTEVEVARVVPGHGKTHLNWPGGADPLKTYLDVLAKDTRAAIEAGTSLSVSVEQIAQSEAEKWQLFDLFNPRNATVAYTELEWE